MQLQKGGNGCGWGSSVLHLFVSAQDGHKSESYLQRQKGLWFFLSPSNVPVLWQCMGVAILLEAPQCTVQGLCEHLPWETAFDLPDQSLSPFPLRCSILNYVTTVKVATCSSGQAAALIIQIYFTMSGPSWLASVNTVSNSKFLHCGISKGLLLITKVNFTSTQGAVFPVWGPLFTFKQEFIVWPR